MNYKYLLFGDNAWEAKSVIENIAKHIGPGSAFKYIKDIKLKGCPAVSIYEFKYENDVIIVKCLGNYGLWTDKFSTVKKYITYFDKPDVVLYSEDKDEIIAAGEFTDTVSVGNSQWQRAQRFISAAILKIPFLAVYAFGEDRSQSTLREASALLTYSYLKLACDNNVPLFLILKDSLYLNAHNHLRKQKGLSNLTLPNGEEIIGTWFGLRLLNSIKSISALNSFEDKIYQFMFDNLYYDVKSRNRILSLVDKDLPSYHSFLPLKTRNLSDIRKVSFKKFCIYNWNISGKDINKSYFKKKVYPLIKDCFKTYNKNGKFAIAKKEYTQNIERILFDMYPLHTKQPWKLGFLDYEKPIVLIPLQVWKKMERENTIDYGYNDPNGGESVVFPSLLDSLDFNSTANIIYVFYGEYPDDWYYNFNKNDQKIYRAVNTIGKLLCVDNNGSRRGPESFKIWRRVIK